MSGAGDLRLVEMEFLEGVIPSMNKRIHYLDNQIELEEQTLEENAELNQKLKERLKANEQGSQKKTMDDKIHAAEEKLKALRAENSRAKTALLLFLDRYYAKPDNSNSNSDDDDSGSGDEDKAPNDIKGLKETVITLMNRYARETGVEQYINVDEMGLWSPYVELLIRSGVAEKHPNDSRLLRLCNF